MPAREGGILRLREIRMSEWDFCVKPSSSQWENSENVSFTNAIRLKMRRGTPVDLKSFIIIPLLVPDLSIGDNVQLDQLNIMGLIGLWIGKHQVALLNH